MRSLACPPLFTMNSLPTPIEDKDSTITLTRLHGRSFLTTLLQALIRPFRPHLVTPGKPVPGGSPKLQPHSSVKSKCEIIEYRINDIYLYDFYPKSKSLNSSTRTNSLNDRNLGGDETEHQLLYFAGGGFQSPPSKEHWKVLAFLCLQLPMYKVTLVSYPLAPNSPASKSLPALHCMLDTLLNNGQGVRGDFSLAGDSAGGNVALSLALTHAQDIDASDGTEHATRMRKKLQNVLVISPPADLRNTNPGIDEADRHDPVLSKGLIEQVAQAWAGDWPRGRPEISPVLADMSALKRAGVKVHGVVGTWDVLAPDAVKFRELCQHSGVRGEWLEWDGQMHCFPLAAVYGLKEGKRGLEWILDVLKRSA